MHTCKFTDRIVHNSIICSTVEWLGPSYNPLMTFKNNHACSRSPMLPELLCLTYLHEALVWGHLRSQHLPHDGQHRRHDVLRLRLLLMTTSLPLAVRQQCHSR